MTIPSASEIWSWATEWLALQSDLSRRLVLSLLVVASLWAVRRLLLGWIGRRDTDNRSHYQWTKLTAYIAAVIGLVILGRLWFTGFGTLGTFLGLLSAGIAIALRDPLANIAAWLFIVLRSPFGVGDRIEIAGLRGDVIDLRLFEFTIMEIGNWVQADQSTGRVVHVPNGLVFTASVANYTKGFEFLWNELPVLITFESDWRLAKTKLNEIVEEQAGHLAEEARATLRKAGRRYRLTYSKLTPTVYTSVEASGVCLTLRYLCQPRARRGTAQDLWEAILEWLDSEPNVALAYPTQRWTAGDAPPPGPPGYNPGP